MVAVGGIHSEFGTLLKLKQLLLGFVRLLAHVADREGEAEAYHAQDTYGHQESSIGIYVF